MNKLQLGRVMIHEWNDKGFFFSCLLPSIDKNFLLNDAIVTCGKILISVTALTLFVKTLHHPCVCINLSERICINGENFTNFKFSHSYLIKNEFCLDVSQEVLGNGCTATEQEIKKLFFSLLMLLRQRSKKKKKKYNREDEDWKVFASLRLLFLLHFLKVKE